MLGEANSSSNNVKLFMFLYEKRWSFVLRVDLTKLEQQNVLF
jgi:hypothetical protein